MATILHLENEDFDNQNILKSELIFSDDKNTLKIGKDDLCMIMIYANWCPYCVNAKPIYEKFAKECNIKFFKINVDTEKELMTRINKIVGEKFTLPSFYFFKNGKKIGKHNGERTVEGFQTSVNMYK